jgi:hypothetical protein
MTACPSCGAQFTEDLRFCTACGAPASATERAAGAAGGRAQGTVQADHCVTAAPSPGTPLWTHLELPETAPDAQPALPPTGNLGRNLRAALPVRNVLGVGAAVLLASSAVFGLGLFRGELGLQGSSDIGTAWWGVLQLLLTLGASLGPDGLAVGAPVAELVLYCCARCCAACPGLP